MNHFNLAPLRTHTLLLLLILLVGHQDLSATQWEVTSTFGDTGIAGSLPNRVSEAMSGDTITFSDALNGDTIQLTSQITLNTKTLVFIGNGIDSTIIDQTGSNDGRLFAFGLNATIRIEGLTLTGGYIKNGFAGGAISNSGDLTLDHVKVDGNQSDNLGGGISNQGSLIMTNCIISNNKAEKASGSSEGGGGIYNSGTMYISDSEISGNTTDWTSAGIRNTGMLTIDRSYITGNIAAQSAGGILHTGEENNETLLLTIRNSIISGNQAGGFGGGLYNATYGNALVIKTTIAGNVSVATNSRGGGIYQDGFADTKLINSIVAENVANDGPDFYARDNTNFDFDDNNLFGTTPVNDSGNITSPGITIDNPEFVQSVPEAPSSGGDLRLACGSPAINIGKPDTTGLSIGVIDITGSPRIANDTIDVGAYERQDNTNRMVTNTNDSGIGSLRNAVGISCPGDTIFFETSTDGEAIQLTSGEILLTKNLTLIGNDTTHTIIDGNNSSRIFMTDADSIRMEHLTIQNGSSTSASGAGIRKGQGYLSCFAIKVSNNSAAVVGGGIYNRLGDLRIVNSSINNNNSDDGGGIYNSTGDLHIENSAIHSNTAKNRGGGIYNAFGDVSIVNSSVHNNTSALGGGIFISEPHSIHIVNSTIDNNTASGIGGGIYNRSGDLRIVNSSINNNNSDDAGGIFNSEKLHIQGSIISSNYADISGGGIVLSSDDSVSIVNSTIAGNSGGGIELNEAKVTLTNNIIAGNLSNNSGSDITGFVIEDGGFNLIGDTTGVGQYFTVSTLLGSESDPLAPNFIRNATPVDQDGVGGDSGDHRLWCTSPAIDAGTSDTTGLNIGNTDVLGLPRIVNNHIDIGAHEYFSGQLPTELILNSSLTVKEYEVGKSIRALLILDEMDHLFRVEQSVILDPSFSVENVELEVIVDKCEGD